MTTFPITRMIVLSALITGACKNAKFNDSTASQKPSTAGNQLGQSDGKDTSDPTASPTPDVFDPTPTPTTTTTATETASATPEATPSPLPPDVIVGIRPIPGHPSNCHVDGSIQQRINLLTGQIEDLTYYSVGRHDATSCQDSSYSITQLRLLKKDGSTVDHVNTTMKHWPLSCNVGRPDRQYQTNPKLEGNWGTSTDASNLKVSGLRGGLAVAVEWPWLVIKCNAGDSTDFKYELSLDL